MPSRTLRAEVVAHCLKLNASGLNRGTSGNLSVRLGEGLLITPSGVPYEHIEPEDIIAMDMEGRYQHRLEPSSEWRVHRDIYLAKPEAQAVVHAHPIYCTTLAIGELEIPAVHYMIAAAGGSTIRCASYATYGTAELSEAVLAALEGRAACLLAHHGMIATGPSLAKALWLAVEVETVAQLYFNSLLLGIARVLPEDEMARVMERFKTYGLKAKRQPAPIGEMPLPGRETREHGASCT
jgi:L-fuculose-phosphate aldolase